ncbi:MAG: hypothetical protein ACK58T_38080 [Phycisphaerae bacterium]
MERELPGRRRVLTHADASAGRPGVRVTPWSVRKVFAPDEHPTKVTGRVSTGK